MLLGTPYIDLLLEAPEKKRVCVDWNGVIDTYDGGNYLDTEPRKGAKEFLKKLKDKYEVVICTAADIEDAKAWFKENKLEDYIDEITNTKLPAHVYVDDRAIVFDGSFEGLINKIMKYKAHWE